MEVAEYQPPAVGALTMFDEDARDDGWRARMARHREADRLLREASADSALALAKSLAAGAKRDLAEAEILEAISAIASLVPAALAVAMGDALTLEETAARLAMRPRHLATLCRDGRSPVPFVVTEGRRRRFRRVDVDRFVGVERASPSPAVAALAAAISTAMAEARKPDVLPTSQAAAALGTTATDLGQRAAQGRAVVIPIHVGGRLRFKRAELEAYLTQQRTTEGIDHGR
jgi:hypothetical protein